MKFERDGWTPLTVTFETREEAAIVHKVLALVTDETEERITYDLFIKLGQGLKPGDLEKYDSEGDLKIWGK